ncbi:LANO_0F14246g1_1 [Lachancea nothofagi CBS 11611]|uniref:LANO_0F14246g1_1 n=1 Tax=Lachancea nothofagi CBS 11611 TaxID=1266666 RepID=A0A1G4KC55_9SACH|nr:LANO_0F14246g1_1 [Lachancea nothofagi CBS 11611]
MSSTSTSAPVGASTSLPGVQNGQKHGSPRTGNGHVQNIVRSNRQHSQGPTPIHQSHHQGYQQPPQTPFDLSYGASLLPSHLLMTSPFITTPNSSVPQRIHGHYGYHGHHGHHQQPHGPYGSFASPYGSSLPLRMPPVNEKRRFRNSNSYRRDDGVRQIAYEIVFRILPRTVTDDESRTRSLLFSNLSQELHLHEFLGKFDRCDRIESVYRVDVEQQSILVSFLTQETCLDFYNGVLQKLSEFKKELKSPELTLNFVHLEDINSGPASQDVKTEVLRMGASRSVALEFSSEISSQVLFEMFPFFNNTGPRYVVECIEFVNTDRISKNFGSHYAVVHFISIAMAIETMEYLRAHHQTLPDLQKFYYVNITSTSGKSDVRMLSSFQTTKDITPQTSNPPLAVTDEIKSLGSKLQQATLQAQTITIGPEKYGSPTLESYDEHLPHITASKPLGMNSSMNGSSASLTSPSPQEVMINDFEDSSSRSSAVSLGPPGTPGPGFNLPGYPYYMDMSNPLGHTLQQQFNTAAQVATTMGGGLGNRTVYIGNINQRSKAEDICNVVRGGLLQSVKFIAPKQICFVTFIEAAAAVQFFANSSIEPIVLHGNVLKVGWGHHSGDLPQSISLAVTIGASRNVYVSLPEHAFKDKFVNDPEFESLQEKYKLPNKEALLKDFRTYGDIEQINFLQDGHCCWINFMNISNAIKLVEDANNNRNGEVFHENFENRYRGLIIGYGKDRCGNVNKNLVANKNSKHYKKVKKTSYKIRMHQQQNNDVDDSDANGTRTDPGKTIQAGAFGISVGSKLPVRDLDEEEKLEETELLRLSHRVNNADGGLGISLPEGEANPKGKDDDCASTDSSEVDIIVSDPNSANHSQLEDSDEQRKKKLEEKKSKGKAKAVDTLYAFNGFSPMVSSTSLDAVPPLAPSTVIRHFHAAAKNGRKNEASSRDQSSDGKSRSSQSQNPSRRRKSKAIPGSDVMAQYLAQLQHSTFMYAANILGVDDGDAPVYYDENGVAEPLT